MTRTVFDTNAIVSALLFNDSVPGLALIKALDTGAILVSATLAQELQDVLNRPRFDRYVTREERDEFLMAFMCEAELVEITETVGACRDPKDDQILELAVSGNADCIVTGDDDLLTMNPFRGIAIIAPIDFLRVSGREETI